MGTQDNEIKNIINMEKLKKELSIFGIPVTIIDNPELVNVLNHLAYVYSVDDVKIITKLIMDSYTESNQINIDELRKNFRDFIKLYEFDDDKLSIARYKLELEKAKGENPNLTQKEQMEIYLTYISPKQMLMDLTRTTELSNHEESIVNNLLESFRLPTSVVNVLLQFVLMQNDMKLPKPYVQSIASHWARKNIKTAREAMELARNEVQNRQTPKRYPDKKAVKPHVAKEPPIGAEQLTEVASDQINKIPDMNDKIKEALQSLITKQVQTITEKSESPIETLLAIQLLQEKVFYEDKFEAYIKISQQVKVENYRTDFLLTIPQHNVNLIIECDGHDFHEKSKEQASNDKARDRKLQSLGFTVFRYTGSDIYADISACTKEIWEFVEQKLGE